MMVHTISHHSYMGNKVKGNLEGPGTVEFKDGHTYEVDLCTRYQGSNTMNSCIHTHTHTHTHTHMVLFLTCRVISIRG